LCAKRKTIYGWDGQSVKALREHMGLSQQSLADELGVRQQTISEWETGMYKPRRSTSKYLSLIAERAGFEYTTDVGGEEGEEF
jgi:putative transcriptional regulator